MESILDSIKKMLGISPEYTEFDVDIIIHINSAFSILTQLGAGPPEGFSIQDNTSIWSDFMINGANPESIKTYVYMRVRLVFDPPTTSVLVEALKAQISEFEWRIQVDVDK